MVSILPYEYNFVFPSTYFVHLNCINEYTLSFEEKTLLALKRENNIGHYKKIVGWDMHAWNN